MVKSPFLKPFPAAIAFFKSKIGLPSENWKTISEEYQAIAFTISSITRLSLLADVKSIIEKQLDSGVSPEAFRSQFKDAIIRAGWDPQFSPYRVNLILSQNVRTAYSFGRWEQSEEPGFKQRHPYRQWIHKDSVVPREHHLRQHLKIYPSDSEIWKAIAPPPFGCKCGYYNLSDRQLKKQALTVSKPPSLSAIAEPGFSKGFAKDLNEQRSQLIERAIASLPPNLAALLQEDTEFSELDFATKKIKDARTCIKGFPCGNSCIARAKMCRKRLEGQYATAAEWLESKLPKAIKAETSKTHTEFIEQGYSAMGNYKAEIDSLLKGNPADYERIKKEYESADAELTAALDNYKMRVMEREKIRDKHKEASDAYFNYEKYNRRSAGKKMEEFRGQLLGEGYSPTVRANILDKIEFVTASTSADSINKVLSSDFTKFDLDESIVEFQQLTNGKSSKSLKVVENLLFANGRAFASREGDLSIGSSPNKRVIFHEMGHHMEFESDSTLQAAKSWIKSRSEGEPQSLNVISGKGSFPYRDDEIAYPDKFVDPYVGKLYPDATEVISMGMEHFISGGKMLELYERDSEHFAFTVGAIKQ